MVPVLPLQLGDRGGCGTLTQARLEGFHHHNCKFARLPLQDTLVLVHQQVPSLGTLQCHLVPQEPILQHPKVAIPVAPLHLATTHRGSTPMGIPHRGIIPMGTPIRDHRECQGAHCATLAATRSTIRSTRRSTPSTMEARQRNSSSNLDIAQQILVGRRHHGCFQHIGMTGRQLQQLPSIL
ncbi:formimidoyltransferase-cyclodeaminase isoform a [Limosa lapponica baueri]|uniref:Formimidoyltransferase-cyclodeaminase isoform a n=1 Tax=Limosa lapponica baueri TaxID=1758121 RepID=A0A2I0TXN2_LIMLA|nr:formimidoyltransferase-cyclodeaminase isoform a [Limosa lapponica baueri]